jgi:hypothetical protein
MQYILEGFEYEIHFSCASHIKGQKNDLDAYDKFSSPIYSKLIFYFARLVMWFMDKVINTCRKYDGKKVVYVINPKITDVDEKWLEENKNSEVNFSCTCFPCGGFNNMAGVRKGLNAREVFNAPILSRIVFRAARFSMFLMDSFINICRKADGNKLIYSK